MSHDSLTLAITTGLHPGASIRPQRMLDVTRRGIRFHAPAEGPGAMTLEQYTDFLRCWKVAREMWDIGLADILDYGKRRFGQEKVDELLGQLNFDLADKMRAYAIGQIPLDLRTDELTSEHLYVLGRLEDKAERGRWMALCAKHGMTALQLKKSIEAGKVITLQELTDQQGGHAGLASIQGVRHWFEDWERKVGGEQKILSMPVDNLRHLCDELRGPGELFIKVKAKLEGQGT